MFTAFANIGFVSAKESNNSEYGFMESIQYSYTKYNKELQDKTEPKAQIIIDAPSYIKAEGDVRKLADFEDRQNVVLTGEEAYVEWEFNVLSEGLYNIEISLCPYMGKGSDIERAIYLNGKIPFDEFNSIVFKRSFQDGNIQVDEMGNQYRPEQKETFQFRKETLITTGSKKTQNYKIYFGKGVNKIGLKSLKEPMLIENIRIFNDNPLLSYEEYIKSYQDKAINTLQSLVIQAEENALKSDRYIYPVNDRLSPMTYPQSIEKTLLNSIGGYNWRYPKQWIEWKFDVKTEGLYKLSFRTLQNFSEGTYSSRRIYIDGETPFREFLDVGVKYKDGWQVITPSINNEPFLIYLKTGEHSIRLENVIGQIGDVIETVQSSVMDLHSVYRKILMITGSVPDTTRDYVFDKTIPECTDVFKVNSNLLNEAKNRLLKITGSKGTDYTLLEKLRLQCDMFYKNPDKIALGFDTFRINLSAVSSWLLTATEQPLLIDYIMLSSKNEKQPADEVSWWERLAYEFKSFFISFYNDYQFNTGDKNYVKEVNLWIGASGRDQAQAIRSLVSNYFTPEKKINVNIKLVDMGILLPAVVTGNGPDVAIGQDRTMPMNYAFRGALYDLSNFSDCKDVLKTYIPGSDTAFRYFDKVYALPETYTCSMMFYRKDIIKELGLQLPKTWNDIYSLLSIMRNYNLEIGFPAVDENMEIFVDLLNQRNSGVYQSKLDKTALTTPEAIDAFTVWAEFYTKHTIQKKMDILTRFRTGESPIVIAPYTFYNNITVAAPEISGLWDFTTVPGTKDINGNINKTIMGSGNGAVMFKNARDKASSWEFLKWWTSAETQSRFNLEMEGLQGPSARIAPSTYEAIKMLPWQTSVQNKIIDQLTYTKGLEEVPGGYMTSRYISTAILLCINNGLSPREVISDYSKLIDDEIQTKRKEFGLDKGDGK